MKSEIERYTDDLQNKDPIVRLRAARLIQSMGPSGYPAVDRLTDLLDDDFPDICRAAADALGSIGSKASSCLNKIIYLMNEDSPKGAILRPGMCMILSGLLPPPQSQITSIASALAESMGSQFAESRIAAAFSFYLLGDYSLKHIDIIIKSLGDDAQDVRFWSSTALANFHVNIDDNIISIAEFIKGDDDNMVEKLLMCADNSNDHKKDIIEIMKGNYYSMSESVRDTVEDYINKHK